MLAEQHLLGLRGVDDEHDDGLQIGRQCVRRNHHLAALGDEGGAGLFAQLAAGDVVSLVQQVDRGPHAHVAETDNADFHSCFLLRRAKVFESAGVRPSRGLGEAARSP